MGKFYTRIQTKTAQNPTLRGGTYLYGSYKGVPLLPPPPTGVWAIKETAYSGSVNSMGTKQVTTWLVLVGCEYYRFDEGERKPDFVLGWVKISSHDVHARTYLQGDPLIIFLLSLVLISDMSSLYLFFWVSLEWSMPDLGRHVTLK